MKQLNLQSISRPEAFLRNISIKVRSAALEFTSDCKGKILDVGCGNGLFQLELTAKCGNQLKTFGVDYSFKSIKEAKAIFEDNNFSHDCFIMGDAFKMPFPSEYFDGVFCLNWIFNINTLNKINILITEMYRICKKGGLIIFDFRSKTNPILKIKYFYNSLTGRLTTIGHRWKDFDPIINELNFNIVNLQSIGPRFPIFTMGYLAVLQK